MLRPLSASDLSHGLLRAQHFQVAYAVSDIAAARALLRDEHGVREFRTLAGPLPAGGQMHVELAWVGGTMFELMHASGAGSEIYMHRLPPGDGFRMQLHHLGYLVDSAGWEALMARVEAHGIAMPHVSYTEGLMKSCFVDAPGLGHYLEYICPEPAGLALLEGVPVS